MKVCFVGIGSIAKRHIGNLKEIAEEKRFQLQIDAVRRNIAEKPADIDYIYGSVGALPGDYDAIFITNPTEFHMETLTQASGKSKNFFIEKPLISVKRLETVKTFKEDAEAIYYVACPLRYTNVIQYLKKYVSTHQIIGARCISSSYLPEWRLGKDYRDTYSAHKELGGGVSIDLIHEWDYLKYLFGEPQDVIYKSGKKSNLEMDCEDTALYITEYEDKFVELHLDYFGRKAIREVMLFTPEETVVGDIVNSNVSFLKSGESIDFGEKRNDYQKKELLHFLELMKNRKSDNSIKEAYKTILLTQGKLEERE